MPIVKPGSDWDIHGCISSAGYTWCDILGKCIRTWMEACVIPNNCLTWNDGCNICSVIQGDVNTLGMCSEMYCFAQSEPFCQVFSPSLTPLVPPVPYPIAIDPMPVTTMPVTTMPVTTMPVTTMPVIDPIPPVINPFLGDGH